MGKKFRPTLTTNDIRILKIISNQIGISHNSFFLEQSKQLKLAKMSLILMVIKQYYRFKE